MLVLTFEEFVNAQNNKYEALSVINIERVGSSISVITFEREMRDEIPKTNSGRIFMVVVNLIPSDGTQWVQTMKRNDVVFYFDCFGV